MRLTRFRITERQVLLWIMACLFLAYAATFLVAIFRQQVEPVVVNQQPRVRRMAPAAAERSDVRYWLASMFDPSVMALPNPEGFSQRLWRSGPLAELRSGDWNIRPAFLTSPSMEAPVVLLEQPTAAEAVEAVAEKLPASDSGSGVKFAPLDSTSSLLSIMSGPLARRALLSGTNLPVVTNEVSLRATRIRLAVAADGSVRYANIERSSGNETVDAKALDWCRRAQFAPLPGVDGLGLNGLAWGVARIAWMTVPPTATNNAAPTSEPAP